MSLDERAHHDRTERFTSAGRETSFAPDPPGDVGSSVEESAVPLLFSADSEGDAIPLVERVGPSYSPIPADEPPTAEDPGVDDTPHDVAVRTRSLLHGAVASRGWAIGLTVLVAVMIAGVAAVAVVLERDADPRVMVAGSSIERAAAEGTAHEWSYVEVSSALASTEMIGQPIAISALSPDGVTALRHEVTDEASGLIQVFDVDTPTPGTALGTAEELAGRTFPEQRATVMGPPIETELGVAHDYWAMVGTDRVEGRVVLSDPAAIRVAVRIPADADAASGSEALQHQVASLAPTPSQPR